MDFWCSESTSATTSCAASVASELSDDSLIDVEDQDFDPFFPETHVSKAFGHLGPTVIGSYCRGHPASCFVFFSSFFFIVHQSL